MIVKHRATGQIAERIAATLTASGQAAVAWPVETVDDVTGYNAVVIGSAAYNGHWLKPLTISVRAHTCALTDRPGVAVQQWTTQHRDHRRARP